MQTLQYIGRQKLVQTKPVQAEATVSAESATGCRPLSIVVPIANLSKDADRARAFDYLMRRMLAKLDPLEILVVEQAATTAAVEPLAYGSKVRHLVVRSDGPFHKGKLCNRGFELCQAEVVLMIDSDIALNWQAVRDAANSLKPGAVCVPFTSVLRLTREGSEKIYTPKVNARITKQDILSTVIVVGGGSFLIHKQDFFAAGAFDLRYDKGWGVEDEALGRMFRMILEPYRLNVNAYHLYHERNQIALVESPGCTAHRALYKSTLYPQVPVRGMCVVIASWGNDPAHVAATTEAVASWKAATDQPERYCFVESLGREDKPVLKQFVGKNDLYLPLQLEDRHNGIFQKEAEWNLAQNTLAELCPEIQRYMYIDSHLKRDRDSLIVARTNGQLLGRADVVQPFSSISDTQDNAIPSRPGLVCNVLTKHGTSGTPGFAYATTKKAYEQMRGFRLVPTCAGDALAWMRVMQNGYTLPLQVGPPIVRVAKYDSPGVRPRVGYVDCHLVHVNHGSFASRHYVGQSILFNFACSDPKEIITTDDTGQAVACDNPFARAFRACRKRLSTYGNDHKLLRDAWDLAIRAELPMITDAKQLTIAVVLRCGGEYNPDMVRWFANQVQRNVITPHEFVCLSDIAIPGIKTIRLKHDLPTTRSKLEVFRQDIFAPETTSVLLLDLDSVLYRPFTLPACPKDQVFYVRENERRKAWPAWNSSALYFQPSAELGTILSEFLRARDEGRSPDWSFPGEQEWSSSFIYHHLAASHRLADIERILAVRFRPIAQTEAPPDETHVVTWASPGTKPWTESRPWIPPFKKESN